MFLSFLFFIYLNKFRSERVQASENQNVVLVYYRILNILYSLNNVSPYYSTSIYVHNIHMYNDEINIVAHENSMSRTKETKHAQESGASVHKGVTYSCEREPCHLK